MRRRVVAAAKIDDLQAFARRATAAWVRSDLGSDGPGQVPAACGDSCRCFVGGEEILGLSRVMRKPEATALGMVVVLIFSVGGGRPGR